MLVNVGDIYIVMNLSEVVLVHLKCICWQACISRMFPDTTWQLCLKYVTSSTPTQNGVVTMGNNGTTPSGPHTRESDQRD